MFSQLRNIESAFAHIKRFSMLMVLTCACISVYSVHKSLSLVGQMQQKVYVLSGGKALPAYSADRKDNIAVELNDHVKMFHHWFFSLDPDEKVIRGNTARALELADESAKKVYDNLREQGYYNGVISANISQEIEVDSMVLDVAGYPFRFTCYATQRLIRSSSTAVRRLVTRGEARTVARSENNPHGFLIQRWQIVLNKEEPVKGKGNGGV
jgi:conjugative transposon TraK protein